MNRNDNVKDWNFEVESLDIKITPSSESDILNRANNVSDNQDVYDKSFDNEKNDDNFYSAEYLEEDFGEEPIAQPVKKEIDKIMNKEDDSLDELFE